MTREPDETDKSDRTDKDPPKRPGQDATRPLPKRFYKTVTVEARNGAYAVLLDGRPIRTPGKRALDVPAEPLARAIADEWEAQGERIDPATMPLTRLANTAIDAVADRHAEVAADIVAFAGSDLLCYRAEAPEALVERQRKAWDPVLAWAREELDAVFVLREGVMPVEQPASALEAVARAVSVYDPLRLSALHVMTTITGSALLALAHVRGRLGAEEAWTASLVDEDWQRELWGLDVEAEAVRRHKHAEFAAASRFALLLDPR